MKKRRTAALILSAAAFFILLWFSFFITAEANHDCSGDDCTVCQQISLCKAALKNVLSSTGDTGNLVAFINECGDALLFVGAVLPAATLVSLKVKLSN